MSVVLRKCDLADIDRDNQELATSVICTRSARIRQRKKASRSAAYGMNSYVGKILEIHQELPGRIHIVIIQKVVGF